MYFISDQASNRVVALPAIDADALNQPLAPPASIGRLSLPLGLFFDGSRRLHIADSANGRIVTWALETGAWSTFGAGALRRPLDVVVDAKNRIYVVDGQRILRVDAEDGSGAVVLSGLTANQRPIAIAVDITGRIFIIDSRTRGLWFTDDEGGSWQPLGFPEGEVPSKPVSVAARHDGGVLVTDLGNRRIVAVDADGSGTNLIEESDGLTAPVSAREDGPGITVIDAGPVWIRRFLPVGDRYIGADFVRGRRADGTSRFAKPVGLAVGATS